MSMNEKSQARGDPRGPRVVSYNPSEMPARAFALSRGYVICPVCSTPARLPSIPKKVTRAGDGVFKCYGCEQPFLYNPFVDKPKEELVKEKLEMKAFEEDLEEALSRNISEQIAQSILL